MNTKPGTQLVSVIKVADQLGCSPGHVYNLISVGKLRAVEIKATGARTKTRLYAAEVEEFIASHTRRAS